MTQPRIIPFTEYSEPRHSWYKCSKLECRIILG